MYITHLIIKKIYDQSRSIKFKWKIEANKNKN